MDNNIGLRFLAANPGTVKNISANPPYRIYGQFIMVGQGEHSLREMLQSTLNLLILDGTINRMLKKYEAGTGAYYRVATPYYIPST